MKKLLLVILGGVFLCTPPCEASIAKVSSTYYYQSGSYSAILSPAISTTGASLIVVGCWGNTSAATGVTNGGTADTWNLVASIGATPSGYTSLYYAYAPVTSSSQTFSCSFGSAQVASISVIAVSGTMTTSGVYDTSTTGSANDDYITFSSLTPVVVGEMAVMFASNGIDDYSNGCSSITANVSGASATFLEEFAEQCGLHIKITEFFVDTLSTTTAATYSVSFDLSIGGRTGGIVAYFKPAGATTTASKVILFN